MTISIRATNLEKFVNCPMAYKYSPPVDPDKLPFIFGTALHMLVEMHVQWLENQDAVDAILYKFWVKERKMLKAMVECFMKHLEERKLEYVMSEYSMTHRYNDIEQTPILEWTFDLLFKDKDGAYVIVDIKTANKAWDEEHMEGVKQWRIYPHLLKIECWINVKRFEYRIMNKTLSPKLQEVVFEIWEDNDTVVKNYMTDLIIAEDTLTFPAKRNYWCWFCPLYSICKKPKTWEINDTTITLPE